MKIVDKNGNEFQTNDHDNSLTIQQLTESNPEYGAKQDIQDLINEHMKLLQLTMTLAEQVGWCMNEIKNIKSKK